MRRNLWGIRRPIKRPLHRLSDGRRGERRHSAWTLERRRDEHEKTAWTPVPRDVYDDHACFGAVGADRRKGGRGEDDSRLSI